MELPDRVPVPDRRVLRAAFALLVVLSALPLGFAYATADSGAVADRQAPPTDGITVVTVHAFDPIGHIVAYAPDGSRLYTNDTYDAYFDVDPVSGTAATVEYVAVSEITERSGVCDQPPCARNVIERVNLTTGDVERLHATVVEDYHGHEWHDVDRIDDQRLLVADIGGNGVFVLNTTTDVVEWRWNAQSHYPLEAGGGYPSDWTHLNDVERLPDGRYMASPRNMDEVIFINESGVQEAWTLGEDGDHSVLYEQHNPDYIPAGEGGPAVVVADSENDRLVEFQRVDGRWEQSWVWADARLSWPRDADRLPDGDTLVTDTHGDRIAVVAPNGSVTWSVDVTNPYEAERLSSPDESEDGPAATAANLQSREPGGGDGSGGGSPVGVLLSLIPAKLRHGLLFVIPSWFDAVHVLPLGVGLATAATWVALELRWANLGVQWPLYRR
ncbi:arylsulfotransferase family protein [Halorarius halobius]|uniref:arylsulfotransferase family protein n=1 Tax=Halorarius halobius TaxID=2962671 RepID=UPI0020CE0ED7|nr:arylsulfotransferase family protein [Halorarius halobius]